MIQKSRPEPAVELCGLTKRYGSSTVVDGLNLQIPRGTTFGLIGPNGAGKSTTLKMLMGLLRIDAGTARAVGIDVSVDPAAVRRRVGYVPEVHSICRWMRISEVIRFVRAFYPDWNDGLAGDLLDLFELQPTKKVRHLSKGMLAKLALLLAVSHEPELLVLDEPMSGLDPIVREEFLDGVLRAICDRDRDRTVLFSSHTIDDVQRLADTVGLLYQGRLLVHRPLDELLAETKRIRAVLRDGALPRWLPETTIWQRVHRREWLLTVGNFSPEIVPRLESENLVQTVEVLDLNLEDVFKDYVKGRRGAA
jgi:ABC-2 type transport system ATP-binding protein